MHIYMRVYACARIYLYVCMYMYSSKNERPQAARRRSTQPPTSPGERGREGTSQIFPFRHKAANSTNIYVTRKLRVYAIKLFITYQCDICFGKGNISKTSNIYA